MRILFLSLEFVQGTIFSGNGVYASEQVKALRKLGHEVLVVCGVPSSCKDSPSPPCTQDPVNSCLTIALPVWGRLDVHSSWKEYAQSFNDPDIFHRIAEFCPDIVVGVDWHAGAAFDTLSTAFRRRRIPIPPYYCNNYRVFLRNASLDEERQIVEKFERLSLELACAGVAVLCRDDEAYIREHYLMNGKNNNNNNSTVIFPPLRTDLAILPYRPPQQPRKYLTCCVRVSPEKEPHRFVDILIELKRRGTLEKLNTTPVVVGSGWQVEQGNNNAADNNAYATLVSQKLYTHVPECLVLNSFLDAQQMASLYVATRLNIHPCLYDAYGMTIVEAASQGAPSVFHHGGGAIVKVGAGDLLKPEDGMSFSVDLARNVEAVADDIEELLKDEKKLEMVGQKAMGVARGWTVEKNGQALVTAIEDGLDRHWYNVNALLAGEELSFIQERRGESKDSVLHNTIEVCDPNTLSYELFKTRYLAAFRPVILPGITSDWRATRDWVYEDQVNIDYLEKHFGDARVSVTDTRARHGAPCREMSLAEYCSWWRKHCQAREQKSDEEPESLLYLKDWHFVGAFPEYGAYRCPRFFTDDWLNEWYDYKDNKDRSESVKCSDYRFVYLGPKGSSTPLHTDVLKSHSWSVNVIGTKLWRLLPPEYAYLVEDDNGMCPYVDFYSTSTEGASARNHVIEVVQHPGEALFVPSNWYHTVENLDDCLSINHNWISTESLRNSWQFLQHEYLRASRLLVDCREISSPVEVERLIQRNLSASAGMDCVEFGRMVRYCVEGAIRQLTANDGAQGQTLERIYAAEGILKQLKQIFEQVGENSLGDGEDKATKAMFQNEEAATESLYLRCRSCITQFEN